MSGNDGASDAQTQQQESSGSGMNHVLYTSNSNNITSNIGYQNQNQQQQQQQQHQQQQQQHQQQQQMETGNTEVPNDDGNSDSNKRTAMAGQWRTPPTMLFFPGMSAEQRQQLENQHQLSQEQLQQQQQLAQQQQHVYQQQQHSFQQPQQQHMMYQQADQQQQYQQSQMPNPEQQQTQTSHVVRAGSHSNLASSAEQVSSNSNGGGVAATSLAMAPAASNSSISSMEGSNYAAAHHQQTQQPSVVFPGVVTGIPHSTEDYAKALQEAYRRGAEAAAMAAAAQVMRGESGALSNIGSHPNLAGLVSAASCPDFTRSQHPPQPQPASVQQQAPQQHIQPPQSQAYVANHPGATMTVIPQVQPSAFQFQPVSGGSSGVTSMPPPPPVTSSLPDPMQYQRTPMAAQQPMSHSASLPMIQQQSQQLQQQPDLTMTQQQPQQTSYQQQRSVSLPDMSSYAAQQEEEKRQKRLARNRASARLRRLRKKNLVDAYEVEVGILEKTLQMLKEHEWGGSDDKMDGNNEGRASALAAALSMDRGQQQLTAEERKQAASDILQQQLLFLEQLECLLQEQYILHEVARMQLNSEAVESKEPEKDNFDDLKETLQLSDEQARELQEASANWQQEWNALQTVKASLLAMKENDWLWNDGCIETADQFLRILHKNQISKLLLWCDHNVEAIDELDCVSARPADSPTAPGPIFSFGVDSHPGDFLDDEKDK